MNLTAGATLQNSKYVIRALLNQSDLGATYEAFHAYLECPVILQTLNPMTQQRSDFAELRQQFMAGVRRLTQQQGPDTVRVLDYFEEAELPFVVLEHNSAQTPHEFQMLQFLPITDELPLTGATPEANSLTAIDSVTDVAAVVRAIAAKANPQPTPNEPQSENPLAAAVAGSPEFTAAADSLGASETLPPAPAAHGTDPLLQFGSGQSESEQPGNTAARSPAALATQMIPRFTPAPSSFSSTARARYWIPLLLLASCVGGTLGVGLGLSLRLKPVSQSPESPRIAPSLFSREQTFPADAEWPVTEPPDYLTSDPVEQPVYRVNTPLESYGAPLPLPSDPWTPPPPLPAEEAAPVETAPSDPAPALDSLDPIPSAAPSGVTPPPAPVAPPPAATLPAAPEPAPPPAPIAPPAIAEPPVAEPPPPASEPRSAPPPMVIRQ